MAKIVNGKMVIELQVSADGMDVATAALYCGVGRSVIRKAVREGTLEHTLVGKEGAKRKTTRLTQKSLDQWLIDFPPGTRSRSKGPKLPYRAKRIASVRGWVEKEPMDAGKKKIVVDVLNSMLADALAADAAAKAKEAQTAPAAPAK